MKTEDSSVPAEARSPYRYHDHLIRFTAVGIELPQTDIVSWIAVNELLCKQQMELYLRKRNIYVPEYMNRHFSTRAL